MSAQKRRGKRATSRRGAASRADTSGPRAVRGEASPHVVRDGAGKVHLRLRIDPHTGGRRLELKKNVFFETWQNRLSVAAAHTALSLLGERVDPEAVAELGKSAMQSTSKMIEGLLAQAPPGSVACREACAHCCYQSVGVTPPEAVTIFWYLLESRSEDELSSLKEALIESCEKSRGLGRQQRTSLDFPCPFLENKRCSIYEVRPLSCRAMHSLDASICERKLTDTSLRAQYFEGELAGHSFVEPTRAMHAISAGLQLCLSEIFGLDMRPLDLSAAVLALLRDQGSAHRGGKGRCQRFVAGEPAFEDCLGGDATADDVQRSLAGLLSSSDK